MMTNSTVGASFFFPYRVDTLLIYFLFPSPCCSHLVCNHQPKHHLNTPQLIPPFGIIKKWCSKPTEQLRLIRKMIVKNNTNIVTKTGGNKH